MPCVSVRNNHARKASIKAASIERKNNRENTRLAKKQQSVAAKSAAQAAKLSAKASKAAAKSAKAQAKIDAKAAKVRQSLEQRVTKKHQVHRAKVKAARIKTAQAEAKLASAAAKTAAKAAARTARAQKLKNSTQKLKSSATKLKTSVKKPAKILKSSLETVKKTHQSRQDAKKSQKAARAQAKAQARTAAKAQSSKTTPDAARTAKISGASVQNSFKIPRDHTAARSHAPTRIVATPIYTPKPLRRTAFMTRDDLINAESRLGSTIFGPVPAGHRREFFHDQENIWIWFESWHDATDHPRQLTVRYEVRPSGVYKKISAGAYFKLAGDELENFRRATHAYLHLVKKYLYPNVVSTK